MSDFTIDTLDEAIQEIRKILTKSRGDVLFQPSSGIVFCPRFSDEEMAKARQIMDNTPQ